jgi:glycosyltransferase involved in cell wall biosynthesis
VTSPSDQTAHVAPSNAEPPRLSFCIPTYNGARFLPELIAMLATLPRHSFEIVALDDGSKDDTVAVLTALAAEYPMLRVHKQPHNVGFVRNFTAVCHLARGDYIYAISQDDIPLVEGLARGLDRLMASPNAVMLFGNVTTFRDSDAVDVNGVFTDGKILADGAVGPNSMHILYQTFFYQLEYAIMRRETFQRFYYNEGHVLSVGWYLVGSLGRHGDTLLSPEYLLMKRKHADTLTESITEPWFQELVRRDLESFLSMMPGIDFNMRVSLLLEKIVSLYHHGMTFAANQQKPALALQFLNRLRGYGVHPEGEDDAELERSRLLLAAYERLSGFLSTLPTLRRVAIERSVVERPEFAVMGSTFPIELIAVIKTEYLPILPDVPDQFVIAENRETLLQRLANTGCDPSRQRAFADIVESLRMPKI